MIWASETTTPARLCSGAIEGRSSGAGQALDQVRRYAVGQVYRRVDNLASGEVGSSKSRPGSREAVVQSSTPVRAAAVWCVASAWMGGKAAPS